MGQIRALLGLTRMTPAEIFALANAVYRGMNGNPAFPNPPVKMEALHAAIDAGSAALAASLDRGKKAIARRDEQTQIVMRMLRQLANYVQHHCNDDLPTFLSSRFAAAPQRSGPKPSVSDSIRSIDPGNTSGQIRLTLVRFPGAAYYQVRWRPAPEGADSEDWSMQPVLRVHGTLISGLTPGVTYAFQVRALLQSGYTDWSDSITRICT